MVESITLQEQFSMPLVKELITENEKLTALLAGTKLPDSKIEDISVPHVFKNKLLMNEGEHNGIFYTTDEIKLAVDDAAEKGLVYDHQDTVGKGVSNWVGHIINPRWDDAGPQGAGMYGDLKVVDKACAQLLASGAKWGVSPAIDYQKNEVEGTIYGTDLLWKSFSFVLSPAVRETMLNAKKEKGDLTMDKIKEDRLAELEELQKKKLPYKYPQDTEDDKKKKKKKEEELQVSAETLDVLQAKDEQITELQKFKTDIEKTQKEGIISELTANEFLIGRLEEDELADREKTLMEKSPEVLKELADVVGSHADLSAYTAFVKAYMKKHKGSTIAQAAKAWKKKKPAKEKGKLEVKPKGMPSDTPLAPQQPATEAAKENLEEEDADAGDDDMGDDKTGSAALTGQDSEDAERALAELKAKNPSTPTNQTDVDFHAALLRIGSRGVR